MDYWAVVLLVALILWFSHIQKLDKGESIPDYIAQHTQDNQVDELGVAEVLFILVAHHPRLHPRSESNNNLPLRLVVCKLLTPDPMLSYPDSRVWDIDLTKAVEKPEYNGFSVEDALLREVFACRVLAYATNRSEYDMTLFKRKKRDVDAARKQALLPPEEEATSKQVLLDDAARIRLVRVHHQSMIYNNLS
jgi:hypothetical protein